MVTEPGGGDRADYIEFLQKYSACGLLLICFRYCAFGAVVLRFRCVFIVFLLFGRGDGVCSAPLTKCRWSRRFAVRSVRDRAFGRASPTARTVGWVL